MINKYCSIHLTLITIKLFSNEVITQYWVVDYVKWGNSEVYILYSEMSVMFSVLNTM
jgi:hypothetical protein